MAKAGQVKPPSPDLFVATVDDGARDEALRLVTRLRHQGFRVDWDTRGGSLKSQMKRSDKAGARFTLVLGADELTARAGKLKRMADRSEQLVGFDALPAALRA